MRVSLGLLRDHINLLLVVEGRVDDAREKFPDMEEDVFAEIVANQPAGSNNKYLVWSCKQVEELMADDEDRMAIRNVIQAVRLFDGNQQRLKQRDLNQYKSIEEVETAVAELGKSKGEEKKQVRSDTDTIYNDDRWLVVRPHTKDSSCKYGVGSKWCIAATGSYNYFNSYSTSNNKFYFVIDKQGKAGAHDSKYALAIIAPGQGAGGRQLQVYDASDKLVDISVVARLVGDKWDEIWKKIQEHVAKFPKTREVEEAEKATEEHVKALLAGEKLGETAIKKVANDGKLTVPVVKALLKHFEGHNGPTDYRDPRGDVMNSLSNRAGELAPESAVAVMKWIDSTRPEAGGYWNGKYYMDRMITGANLGPQNFIDLAKDANEDLLAAIFTNPNAPEELKTKISAAVLKFKSDEAQRKIYWELIKSGKITREQMQHAMTVGRHGYNYLASQILQHPTECNLPGELIRMVPIKSAEDFKKLLEMPNVPPDHAVAALTKLIADGQIKKYDLYQILKTVPLDNDQVELLWKNNKGQDTRTALLQNPAIGVGNASTFAKSKNSAYRFAIAHNTITPPEDLTVLADDESASTRSAVGANPKTPPETLTKLARDEAVAVRASVASNASTPQRVLIALKKDSDEFVRKAVRKTLKALGVTENLIRFMMGMGGPLLEALEDDDTPDVMTPSWRDIPTRAIEPEEFIAVFLLQNNGHATREEISNAYQDWMGVAGSKEIWKRDDRYSDKIIRGVMAGGKGWFWSPPGINKGALFRLTPAGASAALEVLTKYRSRAGESRTEINSAQAKSGKTYYTQTLVAAHDITGYEAGDLTMVEVEANGMGQPIRRDGKYVKLSANRSRRQRRRQQSAKLYKYESPAGEVKYKESFPFVQVPSNSAVTFVKSMYGIEGGGGYARRGQANQAIVKWEGKTLLMPFPLWAGSGGVSVRDTERNVAPPVKKSPPPRELTGEPAAAREPREPGAPRGPKVSYKIYGRKAGKPAHTRLKGQAYGAPMDTQFAPGELASLQATDDGKLKVKKMQGDHEQTWDPVEG